VLWVILSLLFVLWFGKLRVRYCAPFHGDFFIAVGAIKRISNKSRLPHGRTCDVRVLFGENYLFACVYQWYSFCDQCSMSVFNFATPWTVADLKRFFKYKRRFWNLDNNPHIIRPKIRHFCVIVVHIVVIEIVVLVWRLSTTWNHNLNKWKYLLLDACATIRLCLCMIMNTNTKNYWL